MGVLSSDIRSGKDCVDFLYLEHEHSIFEELTLELNSCCYKTEYIFDLCLLTVCSYNSVCFYPLISFMHGLLAGVICH